MVEAQYNEILFFSSLLAFSEFVNPTGDNFDPRVSRVSPGLSGDSGESPSSLVGLTNSHADMSTHHGGLIFFLS